MKTFDSREFITRVATRLAKKFGAKEVGEPHLLLALCDESAVGGSPLGLVTLRENGVTQHQIISLFCNNDAERDMNETCSLAQEVTATLATAADMAQMYRHSCVGPEHVLMALLVSSTAAHIWKGLGIEPAQIRDAIISRLGLRPPSLASAA